MLQINPMEIELDPTYFPSKKMKMNGQSQLMKQICNKQTEKKIETLNLE